MATTSECAGELIHLKDRIHRRWFDLQGYPLHQKRVDSDLFQKKSVDVILELANESLSKARGCVSENSSRIKLLEATVRKISANIPNWTIEKELGIEYYAVPHQRATDFLIEDLNVLANEVHKIGSALIQTEGTYAGCNLEVGVDLHDVNSGALSYCEGASGISKSKAAILMDKGTKIEHVLGAHKNVFKVKEDEAGYAVELKYTESGYPNSGARMDAVVDHLKDDFGLSCRTGMSIAECEGTMSDLDQVRLMANFLSSLSDIDLLEEWCIPGVVDNAFDKAVKRHGEFGASVWEHTIQRTDSTTGGEYCPQQREDYEEREEEDYDRRRHRHFIESYYYRAQNSRHKAAEAPCSPDKYAAMIVALDSTAKQKKACDAFELADELHLCSKENKKYSRELNTNVAKEVLKTCPIDPIVERIDADYNGTWLEDFYLRGLQAICKVTEDEGCEKAVDRLAKRGYEEEHQSTFPGGRGKVTKEPLFDESLLKKYIPPSYRPEFAETGGTQEKLGLKRARVMPQCTPCLSQPIKELLTNTVAEPELHKMIADMPQCPKGITLNFCPVSVGDGRRRHHHQESGEKKKTRAKRL